MIQNRIFYIIFNQGWKCNKMQNQIYQKMHLKTKCLFCERMVEEKVNRRRGNYNNVIISAYSLRWVDKTLNICLTLTLDPGFHHILVDIHSYVSVNILW